MLSYLVEELKAAKSDFSKVRGWCLRDFGWKVAASRKQCINKRTQRYELIAHETGGMPTRVPN